MELKARDGLARICEFQTPHGIIETPTVMPVINPNLNSIDMNKLRRDGLQTVITNSYIIRRNPELREKALKNGIHSLIGFDGPVMTDSGTFQSYVYGDFEFDNLSQVQFQKDIGSDIGTIVDIFSTPGDSRLEAEYAVNETYRRYVEASRSDMILSAPIQGSVHMDLRRRAARLMNSAAPGYFAIGGVVPLLESYRYETLVDIIGNVKRRLNPAIPVHLFGAGHPMFIPLSVLMGVDFFDSASYVKYARDNRLLFSDGTRDLSKISDFPVWSPLYGHYRPSELISMESEKRIVLLSEHNLHAIFNEIREVKERIREQTLWNYVEAKSRVHPALHRAFRYFTSRHARAESYELSRRNPFLYFDRFSLKHPVTARFRNFIAEFLAGRNCATVILPGKIVTPTDTRHELLRDIYENSVGNFMMLWNGIPVPVELMNTFPVQQSITSGFFSENTVSQESFIRNQTGNPDVIMFTGLKDIEHLRRKSFRNMEREQLRVVSEYQFGLQDGSGFIPDGAVIRTSRKTGRVRTVQIGSRIIGTLRPSDGLLTLTYAGADHLNRVLPEGKMSVEVNDDSEPFNSKGLNVFAKFITRADPGILPGNEVLIKNRKELIAVGHSFLTGKEMARFERGVAVNVHQGRNSGE